MRRRRRRWLRTDAVKQLIVNPGEPLHLLEPAAQHAAQGLVLQRLGDQVEHQVAQPQPRGAQLRLGLGQALTDIGVLTPLARELELQSRSRSTRAARRHGGRLPAPGARSRCMWSKWSKVARSWRSLATKSLERQRALPSKRVDPDRGDGHRDDQREERSEHHDADAGARAVQAGTLADETERAEKRATRRPRPRTASTWPASYLARHRAEHPPDRRRPSALSNPKPRTVSSATV